MEDTRGHDCAKRCPCGPGRVRRWASRLLLASLAAGLTGCAGLDRDADLTRRLDAVLSPLVAANQFSGAVSMSRHGRPIYQRGYGIANHAAGLAFTPHTPADGASLAKTFTAAGIWLLVHEGSVDPDAPVTRYVREFPHAHTTVRHLLAHSNGLPAQYEFFDPYFAQDQVRTTHALLRVVAEQAPSPAFEPGTRFQYSNLGFDVVALVIERVTGQDFEAFVKERFLSRLGMNDTFARPARLADWKGVRTLGYRWRDASWQPFDVFDMEAFLGASNLYFSAADLGRWANAHATGSALPAAVLSAGQRRSVIGGRPSAITALSWYCDERGLRCYYTGSLNAFHSFVYWDLERGESVAFVSNSSMPPWLTITLQRALVDTLAGRPVRVDPPLAFTAFDRDSEPLVAGIYVGDGIGAVHVSQREAGLTLRVDCGLEFELFRVSRDVFYVPGTDFWIAFGGGPRPPTLHLRSMFVDATLSRPHLQDQARTCP